MTIGDVPGPVTDPRAAELLARHRELFGGSAVPVPVESIAEDLLGLRIAESDGLPVSGLLLPREREIWLNAAEACQSAGRRRFTIAHELGHWVCQVLEGHRAPIYCRQAAIHTGAGAEPANPHPLETHPAAGAEPQQGVGAGPVRPATTPPLQREANVFAAEFLMPEPAVRNAFSPDDSVEAMATRFDVSQEAMHWRLFNFGLVGERPA